MRLSTWPAAGARRLQVAEHRVDVAQAVGVGLGDLRAGAAGRLRAPRPPGRATSKTLSVGVDGAIWNWSPLAGVPLTVTVMPSTAIAWPET